MKLTLRTEYALLALVHLAKYADQGLLSADEISTATAVPKGFLQQILLSLKQAGFVRTVRGHDGGYELSREAKTIILADIVRHFEGPLAATTSVSENFYHPTPIEKEAGLVKLFKKIRDEVAKILERTTLADVVMGHKVKASGKNTAKRC